MDENQPAHAGEDGNVGANVLAVDDAEGDNNDDDDDDDKADSVKVGGIGGGGGGEVEMGEKGGAGLGTLSIKV